MKKKVYVVFKVNRTTGRKLYKANKCVDGWITAPDGCWKFSERGARQIVERLIKRDVNGFYEYGYE